MATSPSKRRITNVSTNETLLDQAVTVEYDCRGKRVQKVCDDAIAAKSLFVKKDAQGLNPKIIGPKQLIPAVAYVRKSTAGIRPDGGERQEKSIPAQKAEIEKLARQENCKIIRWYEDPGKSGWKRGIERPEFDRMLKDARELRDFRVIIVDEADRFTRATWRKAVIDIDGLNDAGVEKIISAKDGVFDIADEHDAGEAHRLIAIAMGNHEFCRKLSRRVARGLRDRAREGKRAGGVAPYGMENVKDERGKVAYLKHGDRKKLAVVRRIFKTFVRRDCPSLHSITSDLNKDKIPPPRGGALWYVATVRDLLKQPAYRGDFAYGRTQTGVFFTTSKDGEIVEVKDKPKPWQLGAPVELHTKTHTPVVPPEMWDEAQRRLASLSMKGSRRPRKDRYALSGILYCANCGKKMYGCVPTGRGYREYRCSTTAKTGRGTCPSGGTPSIREEIILPWFMERLNIEIKDVTQLLSAPPDELVAPGKQRRQELKERADERTRINAKIKNMVAAFSSIPADDKETRTELYAQIKKLRDEEAALADDGDAEPDYRHEELDALVDWWDDLYRKAVHFPAKGKKPDQETFFSNVVVEERTPKGKIILWGDDGKQVKKEEVFAVVDPHMINEALHTLGAKIEMTWNNDPVTLRDGRKESRFDLDILQYKLGSQGETLTGKKLPIFRSVRAAAPCNDTPAAGRSDNRTDTD